MLNLVVCERCKLAKKYEEAKAEGWLIGRLEDKREGGGTDIRIVVRCPEHISEHARGMVGLPKEHRNQRIIENVKRGLFYRGTDFLAGVRQSNGKYVMNVAFTEKDGAIKKSTEATDDVDVLISYMRRWQPDLRKWSLVPQK